MKEAGPGAAAQAGITYQQFLDNYAKESAIKRLNTVEEVAAMAALLASEVGGGITGALLNVDGGTAQW
jgi:3-hydroxybutyrate dehydrogenase/3-oxoacyl-[acyl-carrier protein] reductase